MCGYTFVKDPEI